MYQMTIIIVSFFLVLLQSLDSSKIIDTKTRTEKQGRDVILPCRFDPFNDKDRVMWLKDGVVLSVNKEISGDRKKYEIINQYDLIMKSVLDHDSGQYICQNFDQLFSRNIVLTILTQPTKPDIQQINESLIENSNGKFLCITYGGNPPPRFAWFINQMQINESLYQIFSNNRRSHSELYLPLEKRFHNTSLICQIENQALEKPLIAIHRLSIQYKPQVSLYYDQMIISSPNLLVMENEFLTIDCRIDANPPLIKPITWLKDSASISGTNPLMLRNLKRTDDGEYTCLSTNSIGHGQSSVHIRVQYAPIVEINGGGIINENERLILVCHVDSYPSIDYYQWYRNNEKLNVSSLASSIIIEKMSKDDAGIYICMVKNTLRYSNGSAVEKFNKTQTKVIVQYAPKVSAPYPIIAEGLSTTDIEFRCDIDSNPESTVHWRFNQQTLFNSNRYSITQNKSSSYLILQQIQSTLDYGLYSCNATNKLGYNFTTIQLRSKAAPDSPTDLNVTYSSYSRISVQWKAGFDGGWQQSFRITLDDQLSKEINQTDFTFTNLRHLEYYNITVRAFNQLGPSATSAFLRVQTKDVPIQRSDLPLIEHSALSLDDKTLHYHLDNSSFLSTKIPLCLRIDISNETNLCERIVTSSGIFDLRDRSVKSIRNLSICLDQYEDYCGESVPIKIKRHRTFNWIFILVAAILTVILLILVGLCIFCVIFKRRRRRNAGFGRENFVSTTMIKKSPQQPVVLEPIISRTPNSTSYFSNITYPEQQQAPSSYSKLSDIDHFQCQKLSMNSSDPIISNLNSSSLSFTDQFDLPPTDFSSADISQCQYMGYSCPIKEDQVESGYSTPLKHCQLNKKTVYEVVV